MRFKLKAEIPSLPVANSQQAVNQTVSGVRGPVEYRSRRHRRARPTRTTHEPAIAQPPTVLMRAARADEALGPPQPLKIVQAVRIGREPGMEFANRPRIVLASTRVRHARRYDDSG